MRLTFDGVEELDLLTLRKHWILLPIALLFIGCAANFHHPSAGVGDPSPDDSQSTVSAADSNPAAPEPELAVPPAAADQVAPATGAEGCFSDAPERDSETSGPAEPAGDGSPLDKHAADKTAQATIDDALEFCQVSQDYWQKGELEKALEALDQAYSLILNIETYEIPELLQQKEDLRFLISKRILEIYASRHIVVNGQHQAIPIDINRHVQAEIDLFTCGKERRFFIESYKRSGRYRRQIVQNLREAGLPLELSWLPLIESGFKVKALSKARALGLWQFIPSTGYKFGLKRNLYVDERLDPLKSTKAAIAYMKELHQIFGDWITVLAAYNCGEGRVLRVIRKQNVNYLDNFWDLYERLPRETARYVPRFLATIHIVNHLEKYGMADIDVAHAQPYETVEVAKQMRLKDVAGLLEIDSGIIRNLNPELRYNLVPPEKYALKVPPGTGGDLLARIDTIPAASSPRGTFVYHRVKPGETLSTIARRYRTSVRSIVVANNIYKRNYIVAGQRLKIPQKGTTIPRPLQIATAPQGKTGLYVVRRGDSLWNIANRYGTTTQKIQALNNLKTTRLHINQKLKIPGRQKKTAGQSALKTYLVKHGDSPYTIAQKHRIPLQRFLLLNNLTKRSKIYPGQALYIE